MRRSIPALAAVLAALALAPAVRAGDDGKPAPPPTAKPADPILDLVERFKDSQPADVRLAAAKEAAATDDVRLIAPLSRALKADEEDVRLAAVAALARRTMPDSKKRAATALLERSKALQQALEKDLTKQDELLAVLRALHDLAQETTIDGLLDGVEMGVDLEVVSARVMAAANVPSAKAIEGLIDLMARRHRDGTGIRAAATKALVYATGVKGPNDADTWRAWWKDHKATFDFQAAAAEREKERADRSERDAKKKDAKDKRKAPPTPKDGEKKPSDG